MSRVLVLFATVDGQTARIAERIAAGLRQAGHTADTLAADSPDVPAAIAAHDAVVVGGCIRRGRHLPYLEEVVRRNLAAIATRPGGFFSVCLSAGGPGARPLAAAQYIDEFLRRTGWRPRTVASFAGALLYTRYSLFIRLMIRFIMGWTGGDTDTSRDYEYTDWQAVDRFAGEIHGQLARMHAQQQEEALQ